MEWSLPILIFLARICDVSIGTVRMIFMISGHKYVAAGLGFVEVCVWVLAVGGVISSLDDWLAIVAYGGGFAAGTLIGMKIEEMIAIGHRIVQVINTNKDVDLSRELRSRDYRVTRFEGTGRDGPVEIAFTVVRRKHLGKLLALVEELAPRAFVSVERVDRAHGEIFAVDRAVGRRAWGKFGGVRK